MSDVMLGAETGGLSALASRLGTTTTEIGACQTDCQTIQVTVCGAMEDAFATAINSLSATRSNLDQTVQAAAGQLADTRWTGANRANFDGAYQGFQGAMTSLNQAIDAAYSQFQANMQQMNALMETFQRDVAVSMGQAQDSTTSMQNAVTAQQANLESVMNTGLSY